MEAWGKFEKAGTEINRLPAEDLPKFQRVAVPIWFKWANKDKDAARIFKLQLEVMESPTVGYVTPDMYKGLKIELSSRRAAPVAADTLRRGAFGRRALR